MSLQQSIRGVFWFFLIATLANYNLSFAGPAQTFYVCDTQRYSYLNCPDKSFPTLAAAINAAGKVETRIVLLHDTAGAIIPRGSGVLGIYANRQIVNTPIVVQGSAVPTLDVVGIRFVAGDKNNIIDMGSSGRTATVVDNCFEGGDKAMSSKRGAVDLRDNFFLGNQRSIDIANVTLKSKGDSFSGIKTKVIFISGKSARFDSATIAKATSKVVIEILGSDVSFAALDVSGVEAFTLFRLDGKTTKLSVADSQIYNNPGFRSEGTRMFEVWDGGINALNITNTVVKDNVEGILFSFSKGHPRTVTIEGLYANFSDGNIAKPPELRASDSVMITDSLIIGNGDLTNKTFFTAGQFYISGSNLMNFGGFEFRIVDSLDIRSSIMEAGDSPQSMEIFSKNTIFHSTELLLGEQSSMIFESGAEGAILEGVRADLAVIDAATLNTLSVSKSTFDGDGTSTLELTLAASDNSLESNDFDVPPSGLTLGWVPGSTVIAHNNIFNPIITLSSGSRGQIDFTRNYWGDDPDLIKGQQQECGAKGVNCDNPLAQAPNIPASRYPGLVMKDIVPKSIQVSCQALKGETLQYIYTTFGGDPFVSQQEEEEEENKNSLTDQGKNH